MLPEQEFKGGTKMATQQAFEDGEFENSKAIQPLRQLENRPASRRPGDTSLGTVAKVP